MTVTERNDWYYAQKADKLERDPYGPDGAGRATVVNGRGFQKWRRFNAGQELIWITTMEGRMVALTPKQAQVFDLARSLIFDPKTMTEMAAMLHVSVSTVSRALVKLASWGLIAYTSMRGRYASTVIVMRQKADGLDRFREKAKATVRRWSQAAERRVSRLLFNVAPYVIEEGRGYDSLTSWVLGTSTSKDATLTAQLTEWTVQDLREAGII